MDAKRKAAALALATSIAIPMEGLRQWAYRDPVGIPTICFGSTRDVKMGDFKTVEECKALLTKEMYAFISAVDACRPGLPTPVLAAFSSAAYNIGERVACDSKYSTAARLLAEGDYAGGCRALTRFNKSTIMGVKVVLPGLTTRRELERELCLS
jgi:lysozyme